MRIVWPLAFVAAMAGACSEYNREAIEHNNQGMQMLRAGRYSDARERFTRAAEEDHKYDQPLYNLALVYVRQKEWAQAADALTRAIARAPHNADYHYRLGDAHYQLANDPKTTDGAQIAQALDRAKQSFASAVQYDAQLFMAHYRLAQIAETQDDAQTALQKYTETLRANPRMYMSYVRLGNLYYKNHLFQQAAQVLQEGLRVSPAGAPERGQMHNFLGLVFNDQRQLTQAAEEFQAAIREDSQLSGPLFSLGMLYADMPDQKPRAILYLQQFVQSARGTAPRDYIDRANARIVELQSNAP